MITKSKIILRKPAAASGQHDPIEGRKIFVAKFALKRPKMRFLPIFQPPAGGKFWDLGTFATNPPLFRNTRQQGGVVAWNSTDGKASGRGAGDQLCASTAFI